MKAVHLAIIPATLAILAAVQLQAGVRVSSEEQKERRVAFRVSEKKFVTANPGNSLDLTGAKIGSKQTFTLIDFNGGELESGDDVRISYLPNSGGVPDPSKASYWREVPEGVKRGKEGDVFKVIRAGTKYALQTPSGKFVAGPVEGGVLGVSAKQEGALLVELVDVTRGAVAPKTPEQPAASVPEKPATE